MYIVRVLVLVIKTQIYLKTRTDNREYFEFECLEANSRTPPPPPGAHIATQFSDTHFPQKLPTLTILFIPKSNLSCTFPSLSKLT